MKNILLALNFLILICSGSAIAQEKKSGLDNPYRIDRLKKQGVSGVWIDKAWRRNLQCIQADLYVTRKVKEDTKFYVRAYFYNRERKLVHTYKRPSQASRSWESDSGTIPNYLSPKKKYDVYFPITERLKKEYKWKNVLVVFGDKDKAVAKLYKPGVYGKLSDYDFPEKKLIK